MKQIILTRHTDNRIKKDAQLKFNDYELTKIGRKQAEEVRDFLADKDFEVIFSSLYLRAIQTAEIINSKKKVRVYKTNAFNEYLLRSDGSGVETTEMGV